jgi:predicted Zn-dependent peptidase
MTEADERAAQRLKESKAKAINQLLNAGEVAGSRYVQHHADWGELDRLERWNESLGMNRDVVLDDISFRQVADEMDENTAADIESFVRKANGGDIDNPVWVKGFVSGALTKFDELKPALD